MKISVIIPVFYQTKNLKNAIDSALEQNIKENYEIIIINDAMQEETTKTLSEFIKYKHVKIINNPIKVGLNESRNIGIKNASGSLIAFLDPIDCWYEDKLQKQYEVFSKKKGISLCFSDFDIVDKSGTYICNNFDHWSYFKKLIDNSKDYQTCKNIFSVVIKENVIGISSVMVKKSELIKAGLFRKDLSYSEDWDMWLRLAVGHSFAFVNKSLVRHKNLSGKFSKKTEENLINIVNRYQSSCKPKIFNIAKANCYALAGEIAFETKHRKEALFYYFKSFMTRIEMNNIKRLMQHIIH